MKKYAVIVLSLVCFCFIFAGLVMANEKATQGKEGKPDKEAINKGMMKNCPECAGIMTQMHAKKDEMKTLEGKIKALREAERAKWEAQRKAKLEEIKKTDPKKYEEMVAKDAERQKKHGEMGKEHKKSHEPTKEEKERRLSDLKQKNPELYQFITQKEKLHGDMKTLHEELVNCKQTYMGKDKDKGAENKDKDTQKKISKD